MKISLAMIVKNEQRYIERCILSVNGYVDEIVVVDTGSTDNTLQILEKYKHVKVYQFQWTDDFSKARNYSIEKASGDYILILDADEYIIEGTRAELESVVQDNLIGRIKINSRFRKDNEIQIASAYISRFFPKNTRYEGEIHEQIISNLNRKKLKIKVGHDGYMDMNKGDRNIPLLIKALKKRPNDAYYLFQIGKELRIKKQYNEAYKFLIKSYHFSDKQSLFYEELVIEIINSGKECGDLKVLQVIDDNEYLLQNVSDYHFAKGLFYLDFCLSNIGETGRYLHKIESCFLACINLNEREHSEYLNGTSSFLAAYNLAVFYEVIGDFNNAIQYYNFSAKLGYNLARERLALLNKNDK
ncbi:glycosyltransferase family 2 protein [Bacillus sp. AFS040349]|uniref:glycosyltransferase family 2 protein n=1 Tax=Bacillus sp. AFS040349 TaxID=2033502 RepID=UPI000BFC41FA|nr:glycosyltransferase family 2 protein [Bacillus sp. AFS040349]PGT81115.1 glycosyl transferase family 2 [Bacillus sp. AFS040349]